MPFGFIDRESNDEITYLSPGQWQETLAAQQQKIAPVSITVTDSFYDATQEIAATITANCPRCQFLDRIHLILMCFNAAIRRTQIQRFLPETAWACILKKREASVSELRG